LARAKNTSRAEARRRARAATRTEHDAETRELTAESEQPAQDQPRPSFFNPPRFREDLRLLPRILTSRRLLIVPPLMLLIGFALTMMAGQLVGEAAAIADLYVQLFFLPPALLTFFLAGFIAPRASYLVGALLGAFSGLLWAIIIFAGLTTAADPVTDPQADAAAVTSYLFVLNVGYGTFAAAFAAWYRDFLRRMQEQGRARRAEREAKERERRREQRRGDRQSVRRTR